MLGLKIAATGALVMLVSHIVAKAIGDWPGVVQGMPLLIAWFGGGVALVVGFMMAVWA